MVYKSKPLDFPSFPLPVFDRRSSGAALGDEEQLEYVASCYHEPCCQQVQESRRLGDEEQYIASCYHRLCCQQAQESWRQDIRGQWRGKLIKIKLELNKRKNACKIILTWSTGTDILGMVALLEKMMDTTNWEWEPVALLEKTVDTTNWEWEPGCPSWEDGGHDQLGMGT